VRSCTFIGDLDDGERLARRARFESVARAYDEVRPSYPAALFDDLFASLELEPGVRVLEIGAGTGIATRELLRRGLEVVALEPGRDLIEVARERSAGCDRVEFVPTAFEEWSTDERFRAIVAAQSLHWVEPGHLNRLPGMLRPEGAVAAMWNVHDPECPYRRLTQPAYRRIFGQSPTPSLDQMVDGLTRWLRVGGCFAGVEVRRHPWTTRYTTDQVLALIGTFSDHIALDPDQRRALHAGIRAELAKVGDSTEYWRVAVLALACGARAAGPHRTPSD